MQYRVFSIPILGGEGEQEQMNRFLRSVRVVETRKELVTVDMGCFWTFCITFLPLYGGKPTDERKNSREETAKKREQLEASMSEDERARFSLLCNVRTSIAHEESVPAFAVFTNKELAEAAKFPFEVFQEANPPAGVDKKRWKLYAQRLFEALAGDAFPVVSPPEELPNNEESEPPF